MALEQKQKYRSVVLERAEINPCTFGHLIYDKGSNNIQ